LLHSAAALNYADRWAT